MKLNVPVVLLLLVGEIETRFALRMLWVCVEVVGPPTKRNSDSAAIMSLSSSSLVGKPRLKNICSSQCLPKNLLKAEVTPSESEKMSPTA